MLFFLRTIVISPNCFKAYMKKKKGYNTFDKFTVRLRLLPFSFLRIVSFISGNAKKKTHAIFGPRP